MYFPHGTAQLPDDLDLSIWRYMKVSRFEELLERKAIFFTRPDCFDDKFEGMWGAESRKFLENTLREKIANGVNVVGGLDHALQAHKQIADSMRRLTAINCWHQNSHESDAMWKLYVGAKPGIAIRSTIAKLIGSIPTERNLLIHVGMVKYIDYDSEPIPPGNYLTPFAYKRKSFEHEREVRAVAAKAKIEESKDRFSMAITNEEFSKPGENVPIDISELIVAVHLPPGCSSTTEELVSAALVKGKLRVPVLPSKLDEEPV